MGAIVLDNTSKVIRITTDGTEAMDVLASYIDHTSSAATAGSQETLITTATTTDIVDSPASSTQRVVSWVSITNTSATSGNVIVNYYDGTNDHEMGTFDLATDDMLVFDGQKWQIVDRDSASSMRGYIDGLEMSNDTDASHDIAISTGACRDSSDAVTLRLSTILTKQIDANWAAGDDAGGFPSGLTLANTTWYHVFLIKDGSTIDAGFDTSLTATNLLSDATTYTEYRRIGSVLTDGSANILGFSQFGNEFLWDDPPYDINVSSPSSGNQTRTLSCPLGIKTHVIINCHHYDSTAGRLLYVSSPDANAEVPSVAAGPIYSAGNSTAIRGIAGAIKIRTGVLSEINSHFDGVGANLDLDIATLGWIDPRGKDA